MSAVTNSTLLSDLFVSQYGSNMLTARTSHHLDIRNLFERFDKPSGILPQEIEFMINPISLAFWYMDDGSLTHSENQQDRASFSTHSFNASSVKLLQRGLMRMGVSSQVQNTSKGAMIRLNYQESRMMFTMIAPLIPPSMQYKLPLDLRGGPGWCPKPLLIPGYRRSSLRVLSNTDLSPTGARARKLDIITSTGNLYVNGILLKDSSS